MDLPPSASAGDNFFTERLPRESYPPTKTKGQVVIPRRLRKEFHIEEGTRALVTATPEGILIKPVTRHAINRLRGILKRKAGAKSLAEEWVEHRREELELEERKYARSTGSR